MITLKKNKKVAKKITKLPKAFKIVVKKEEPQKILTAEGYRRMLLKKRKAGE
ncbi:MAG: hypothetical protein JWO53_968 [Chlamydiia bacterium]|nr:hypothetical protein [Chlamydiia bacterium]